MTDANRTFVETLHHTGYDREEEYFHDLNRELIERNRRELDALRREREALNLAATHWMKCPKCGHDLLEQELLGLKGDVCTTCGGVYFDKDEIMRLAVTHEPHAFKDTVQHLFSRALEKLPTGIGQFPV